MQSRISKGRYEFRKAQRSGKGGIPLHKLAFEFGLTHWKPFPSQTNMWDKPILQPTQFACGPSAA